MQFGDGSARAGFCANGVCCNAVCTGTCEACTLALTGLPDGSCAPELAGSLAPQGQCTPALPCGNDGKCAANGVCEQGASGVACGTTCLSGQLTINQCNGSGDCVAASASMCAGKLATCATPTACGTMCTADTDCNSGYWCDTSTGACNQQGTPASGAACTASDQCTNGLCVDGYCCNTSCTDTCSSCAVPGLLGICSVEPDNDTNPNHACTTGSTCCSDACTPVDTVAHCGTCGNACPATGTLCQTQSCDSGTCTPIDAKPGTTCSDNGGSVCNATGSCVECNQASDCKGLAVPGCCGSKCIDLSTDGNNCAACGHSCLGGACSGSMCQPATLATFAVCGEGIAGFGIALDATNVYFSESNCDDTGAVQQVPIAGGMTVTLASAADPGGVAVNAHTVYFTNITEASTVDSCAINGCAANPTVLSTSDSSPFGIALDATHAYWVMSKRPPMVFCATAV